MASLLHPFDWGSPACCGLRAARGAPAAELTLPQTGLKEASLGCLLTQPQSLAPETGGFEGKRQVSGGGCGGDPTHLPDAVWTSGC